MEVYFVRHGVTEPNRARIHQSPETPLSEIGKQQTKKTAAVLKDIGATKLITSPFARTREGAAIIGEATGLTPEENPLFAEVLRASVLFDKKHLSFDTFKIGFLMALHFGNPAWHYADEENAADVSRRARSARASLEPLVFEHKRIIVVSHAFFINAFIEHMCTEKDAGRFTYIKILVNAKFMNNASITKVTYTPDVDPRTCDWKLIEYNNHDHLSA